MLLHPQTIEFLKGLEDFNDRKFFELYKPLYLDIKVCFEDFIDQMIQSISIFDENIIWLKAKQCVYRIYKDMRYPRNREHPYKTNLWANISPDGRKSSSAWYYVHIQNNESFFWWWLFMVSPKNAQKIRTYIYKHWNVFEKIIKNPDFIKIFGKITPYHPELKRIPKEFDPKHPSVKYLTYRDWVVAKKISNKNVLSKNLDKTLVKYAKILQPFDDFLNKALY